MSSSIIAPIASSQSTYKKPVEKLLSFLHAHFPKELGPPAGDYLFNADNLRESLPLQGTYAALATILAVIPGAAMVGLSIAGKLAVIGMALAITIGQGTGYFLGGALGGVLGFLSDLVHAKSSFQDTTKWAKEGAQIGQLLGDAIIGIPATLAVLGIETLHYLSMCLFWPLAHDIVTIIKQEASNPVPAIGNLKDYILNLQTAYQKYTNRSIQKAAARILLKPYEQPDIIGQLSIHALDTRDTVVTELYSWKSKFSNWLNSWRSS